jgi:hypothetical protein
LRPAAPARPEPSPPHALSAAALGDRVTALPNGLVFQAKPIFGTHRRKTKKRDYIAELEELLADGVWRTPKEAAKPKNDGGIGANVEKVKALREEPRPLRLLQRKADRAKRTRNRLATDSGV